MSVIIPLSITGSAQTGFTAPTYTTVVDSQPDVNSKQNAVTALGGTQAGVLAHSVNVPFTISVRRPAVLKILAVKLLNGITGKYSKVPTNTYTLLTRKGVSIQSGQTEMMMIRTTFEVPAGADTFDIANVRAAVSAHIGTLNGTSAGFGDTLNNGVLG